MLKVKLQGVEFPLCFTVAALDAVNEKCGGLNGISEFVMGGGDVSASLKNTAWFLSLLMREGEENQIMSAKISGEKVERRYVPTTAEIVHILSPGTAAGYRMLVLDAVNQSLHQTIEAEHPKNGENAELE